MSDDVPDLEPLDVPRPWVAGPAQEPDVSPPPAGRPARAAVAGVVVAMLIAGITGFLVTSRLQADTPFEAVAPLPTPRPLTGVDPDASVLRGLGVQQQEVGAAYTVELLDNGDHVVGETTLDLCNGRYPSEALRTARFQVLEAGPNNVVLSTEAVLYRSPNAATQAFAELRRVSASCPHTPVPSRSGGSTVTTTFGAAPDKAWPATPTVERQAYEFDTVNLQGQSKHSIAVYLRRGRVLMGIYFPQPSGVQPPVGGKTTVAAITQFFAERIAALPAAVVNRHP